MCHTHGSREDNDPQNVHALAAARDNLVLDVWSRGDLKEDRVAKLGVVVVRHHVHIVGLGLTAAGGHDGHEICPILRMEQGVRDQGQRSV